MIIKWENDGALDDIAGDQRFSGIVAELLRTHRQGLHLLVVGRDLANSLGKLALSQADVALLRRLGAEYTQTGALHRSSAFYISILNTLDVRYEHRGSYVEVSLGALSASRVLDRPVLLSENLTTDGWLYDQILAAVATKTGKGAISFDLAHGGGDDIVAVLDDMLDKRRVLVAIVDSDKDSPLTSRNSKLSKASTVITRSAWPLAFAVSPPCREAENIVPLDVMLHLPSAIECDLAPVLLEVTAREDDQAWPYDDRIHHYVDLKLGISQSRLARLEQQDRDWLIEKCGGLLPTGDDWSISGFGDRVIQQIIAEGKHIAQLREKIKERGWTDAFLRFFEHISWYFISSRRLIT